MESTTTFTLTATDGHAMHAKVWVPQEPPVGVVILIHGFYEHLGRYEHVAKFMNDHQMVVYAMDARGHGKTKGIRGHAKFPQVLDDVEQLLMHARAENTELPIVIYGHSWGGCIVSNFLLRKPVNELSAAVLSAAWLKLALTPPKGKALLGDIMSVIWPSLTVANKMEPGTLSRDPAVEEAYLKDPLVHDKISAGIFKQTIAAGEWARQHANELKVPTFVMHGTDDNLIAFSGSEEFAKNAGAMATFHAWEGLRHELHNEPDQLQVLETVWDFIEKTLSLKQSEAKA